MVSPRMSIAHHTRLAGLEPLVITPDLLFINVGERTNEYKSHPEIVKRLTKLLEKYIADGRKRRPDHRHQHGRGPDRFRGGDDALRQPDLLRTGHRPRPVHDRLVQVDGDRGRPALPAGQGHRQLDLDEGRRGAVPGTRTQGAAIRRRGRGDGV
jgi:hypothetical protein